MVEWKSIEQLGCFIGGLTGKSKSDFENGNSYFITYMNVFSNPSLDISTVGSVQINEGEKQNKIQKGDILFTGSSETPDEGGMSCVVTDELFEDFYLNSFCFALRLHNPELYNLHYFKHVFRSHAVRKAISKTASGVTRFNISKARFCKIQIPLPSLSEQSRIVGILDTFTASIANLKEQIGERRKQYEHYRDQLLDLEGKEGVELILLKELATVKRGVRVVKTDLEELGDIPVFQNSLTPLGYKEIHNRNKNTTFVICAGAAGDIGFSETNFWAADDCSTINCGERLIDKYIYHFLMTKQSFLKSKVRKASVPRLASSFIENLKVSLPSLSEQSRIVGILDQFEASIANLEAQLQEREKQYEHYRNQLLTFE